jgi:hypothetical protein
MLTIGEEDRAMRRLVPLALVALAACNSPSPKFMSGAQQEVTVESSTFAVWRVDDRVEVIRTSREFRPRLSVVHDRARVAIRQATGCRVWKGTLKGDHAVIEARLACG